MKFLKTAAVATLVAAAALGAGSAANAGGKHHNHHHHSMKHFHRHHGLIIVGSPDYGCKHWLRKYKRTGNPFFLDRYYACKY
jgi:hypothetical protein